MTQLSPSSSDLIYIVRERTLPYYQLDRSRGQLLGMSTGIGGIGLDGGSGCLIDTLSLGILPYVLNWLQIAVFRMDPACGAIIFVALIIAGLNASSTSRN